MESLSDREQAIAKEQAAKLLQPTHEAEEGGEPSSTPPKVVEKVVVKEVIKDSPAEAKRKEDGRADREQKKLEKAEREAISDLDIQKLMRPYYRYLGRDGGPLRYSECPIIKNGKSKLKQDWESDLNAARLSYSDFLPTLESAKLELFKKGIEFEGVTLWVEIDEDDRAVVVNLFPESKGSLVTEPKKLPARKAWASLIYNDGLGDIVYPIPPPPNKDGNAPIIEDHDWCDLVEYTKSQALDVPRLHAIKLLTEQVPITLPIVDAQGSFSSGNTELSGVEPMFRKAREKLANALKWMGLLESDGQNGMCYADVDVGPDGIVDAIMSYTDTYKANPTKIDEDDPRVLWRDLPELLADHPNFKDELRDQIRHLAWMAFEAGREAEKLRVTDQHGDALREQKKFKDKQVKPGKPREPHTKLFKEAMEEYILSHPDPGEELTGGTVAKFIEVSDRQDWKDALHPPEGKSRIGSLGSFVGRQKGKQTEEQ